jgi:hypothetical protein
VSRFIREGPKPLKEFAHETRTHALLVQTNTEAARKEFLASTVSRSFALQATPSSLHSSVENAKEAWMEERKWDSRLIPAIDHFFEQLPLPRFLDGAPLPDPLPSRNACLTHTQNEGGTAAALGERRVRELAEIVEVICNDGWIEDSYAGAVLGSPDDEKVIEIFDSFEILADVTEGLQTNLPHIDHVRRWHLKLDPASLRPHPLEEMGGKIRVITVHPAEEVQVSRQLTAMWLSSLRGLVTTRDMLQGREVELERTDSKSLLFSADLSKATDYIPHSLALHFARRLSERLGREEDIPHLERIFSPKLLPDGTLTKNGIHMGLGCSWTILSLINSFSAWYAGARKETYAICGDDLIGFWNNQVKDGYVDTLERLGLVVNKSKSFFGKRGVFCEQLVSTSADMTSARARDVGHLSHITAAKAVSGRTTCTFAAADQLQSVKGKEAGMARAAFQKLLPCKKGSGKIRHFGNGSGATLATIRSLLVQGAMCTSHMPLEPNVSEQIKANEDNQGEVPLSQFLIHLNAANWASDASRGRQPRISQMSVPEFRKRNRMTRPTPRDSPDKIRALILRSKHSRADKKSMLHALRIYTRSPTQSILDRLASLAARRRAERYLPFDVCRKLIKRETGMDFGRRLSRTRQVPKLARSHESLRTWSTPTIGTVNPLAKGDRLPAFRRSCQARSVAR